MSYLSPGVVDVSSMLAQVEDGFGILVLDGFLVAKLAVGRGAIGWLVGRDDLIIPWQIDQTALTRTTEWRALTAARVALLDDAFCQRAAAAHALIPTLMTRAARTMHWLLAKSLIASSPLVRHRLLLLFAQLAERWGTVTPEGVWLDIPLTHAVIANLCGARRPPVTCAITALRSEGLLERTSGGGWLLRRWTPGGQVEGFWDYSDALAAALAMPAGAQPNGADRANDRSREGSPPG